MFILLMCCLFSAMEMATDVLPTSIPMLTSDPTRSANLIDINPSISVEIQATHMDTTATTVTRTLTQTVTVAHHTTINNGCTGSVSVTPEPTPVMPIGTAPTAIPDGLQVMPLIESLAIDVTAFTTCQSAFNYVDTHLNIAFNYKDLLGLGCRGVHILFREIRHTLQTQRLQAVIARQDREIRALKARADRNRRK
ncbi:unnamed protein product [Oppiella nova]|uniref:Uncharacterized protein n=1 Tax=Oppiella nova TaxID=334625 RepID=A0A7R9LCV0_9ACAR|nr:unnamed protein product [Oppiella nova]CAG2162331.1 unnamed protein product [Oppiella nova]